MSVGHDTVTWLAQSGECQSVEWEAMGSNPGQTNTQGLKIAEKKVLSGAIVM